MKKAIILTLIFSAACLICTGCEGQFENAGLTKYEITAEYNADAGTIAAKQSVDYYNSTAASVDRLYFHLYPRAYEEDAQFKALDGIASFGEMSVDGVWADRDFSYEIEGADEDILCVSFAEALDPTESVVIKMEYVLRLPVCDHRYGIGQNGTVNLGNFYPILAANDETSPYCKWGDPFFSECASYDVSITVPADLSVVMTGEESATAEGDRIKYSSAVTGVRDFAAVIGKFNKISAKVGETTVNFYCTEQPGKQYLTCATDALATFQRMFGAYGHGDYDVVITGLQHGGMEYPCIVFVSDKLNEEMTKEAIIHETAHQWWYSGVGNDQFSHAWLDEGLAEFSTTLFYRENPAYGVSYDLRISDAASSYMIYLDISMDKKLVMDRHLREFATETDYTFLTYVKGELMFEALHSLVGHDAFVKALKLYYLRNYGKIAAPEDLIAALEETTSLPLENYINGWISGSDKNFRL